VPVIHVHFLVPPGAPGLTLNAPLFEGVIDNKRAGARHLGRGGRSTGLSRSEGDHVVEKMRMSAWEGTALETILKAEGRDMIIETGAWTNMSIEHTARTGADKGYVMVIPEDGCSTMNADWHRAYVDRLRPAERGRRRSAGCHRCGGVRDPGAGCGQAVWQD
jgi:gluconolactonase